METTRLEAIMFTDIAGYSRLMEENEERTIALLKRHNDIVLPVIEVASGSVVDAIGDGLLVVFPSVRKAVECAMTIHQAVDAHNQEAPENERFLLRIGIHLGEIWHEGDRVYGNGVNVAARVQPHAQPGGICITEDVYRQVHGRLDIKIVSIGTRELKNISRRHELYSVVTGHEEGETGPRVQSGELDAIKERVLAQLQRAGEDRRGRGTEPDRSSLEGRIESKVYGLVERVMDHALDKWETMPDEKKQAMIRRANRELDDAGGDDDHDVEINLGSRQMHRRAERHGKRSDGDRSSPVGKVLFGVACTVGFGIGYFQFGVGWMIWLFAILGVLPLVSGITDLAKGAVKRRTYRSERPRELERQVLDAARRLGGRTTVVQLAAETNLQLDDVQETLDRMTAKGYVSQEVLDSGVIRYDFPSLSAPEGE